MNRKKVKDIMTSEEALIKQFNAGIYSGGEIQSYTGEGCGVCPTCGSGISGGATLTTKVKPTKTQIKKEIPFSPQPMQRPAIPSRKISLQQATANAERKAKKAVPESFNEFRAFFQQYREMHPELSFREAQKGASQEWKKYT